MSALEEQIKALEARIAALEAQPAAPPAGNVFTLPFRVVNEQGMTVLELEEDAGSIHFCLFSPGGKQIYYLCMDDDGANMSLFNRNGQVDFMARSGAPGGAVYLANDENHASINLETGDDGARLSVRGPSGNDGAVLGIQPGDIAPSLTLYYRCGDHLARLGPSRNGSGELMLFVGDGAGLRSYGAEKP